MTNLTPEQREVVMQNRIMEMENDMDDAWKEIKLMKEKLIEGNGQLPLMERMRNMETFANTIRFWFRTVAVALVLQTITFGGAAIVYFVKLYPLLEKISANQP